MIWIQTLHFIGGVVLGEDGEDGSDLHPPLRLRWSPDINHESGSQDDNVIPELEVCLLLDLLHRLKLVGPGSHPQQCGGAGVLRVHSA